MELNLFIHTHVITQDEQREDIPVRIFFFFFGTVVEGFVSNKSKEENKNENLRSWTE